MHILMIEDTEAVCEMMEMFFENEGWKASFYHDGKEGLDAFLENQNKWGVVILDVNLPSMDGMQICRQIRQVNQNVPIVMLTARDSESDQVIGLEIGADDYVAKPFSAVTIMARIKALLRRTQRATVADNTFASEFDVETDHVKINTKTHEAFIDGKPIENLTPKEFDLLMVMAKHQRQVFTREHLLTKIWEDPFYGDERTVDAHIKKLRQKIEAVGPHVIHTVWGVGYKFDDSEL